MKIVIDFKLKAKISTSSKKTRKDGFNGYGMIRSNQNVPYGIFAEFLNISGVYYICNKITNKYYIGSTKDIGRRLNKHFSQLRLHNHPSSAMLEDYIKYGFYSFDFGVLEIIYDSSKLLEKEREYQIDKGIENLYNLKITNYYVSERVHVGCGSGNKDSHKTEEYRNKMRKIKLNKIGKFNSNLELVKIYDSVDDAAKDNKLAKSTILGCCNGSKKHAHNWLFKYMDKNNNVIDKGKGRERNILIQCEDIVYAS